uniref:Uncharacterized protein n=1 Tax=Arundo donax TaxID=35708 RepID=A0A0A9HNG1_ARUDO
MVRPFGRSQSCTDSPTHRSLSNSSRLMDIRAR